MISNQLVTMVTCGAMVTAVRPDKPDLTGHMIIRLYTL